MAEELILSIDQGTSGTKAIIFNPEGENVSSFTADYEITYPKSGYVEIDPAALWNSVLESVQGVVKAFEQTGGSRKNIRTVGISNQRESFLLWDADGNPLCPVVVWQCKRSVNLCRQLENDASWIKEIRDKTGLINDPYFSGTKASVLVSEDSRVRDAVRGGRAYFGTIDTWLTWKLTDGAVYATDQTNACRTLFFDINTLDWDSGILDRLNLKGLKLPEVFPSNAGFGTTTLGELLNNPIPVGALIGDSHAAAFGEGLYSAGEAKVTLGTGSSILLNVGSQRIDSDSGLVSTICWSSNEQTVYALEGIIVSCGSTISWLRDNLGLFSENREIDILAESVDSSNGVYLIPGFNGIGAPWWKQDAKASIVGLDFGHDKRHVSRAALESIIYQVKDVLKVMTDDIGRNLTGIKADGGVSTSRFVLDGISSLIGCPVVVPQMKQASAWGAALLAGWNIGLYEDMMDIDRTVCAMKTTLYNIPADKKLLDSYLGWQSIMRNI